VTVLERNGDKVLVQTGGGARNELPLTESRRFQLYKAEPLALAAGDRIRVTQNGFAKGGQRLNNAVFTMWRGLRPRARLRSRNGAVLPKTIWASNAWLLRHLLREPVENGQCPADCAIVH